MTNKTATLIVSINDENLSIVDNTKSKIALDYSILLATNQKIEYLFEGIPDNLENLPTAIARNWYRDSVGIDNHQYKYSIGIVLEKRISYMISNMIKLYFSFLSKIKKYHRIEIPKNYPNYLKDIIHIFKDNIILIPQQKYSDDFKILFAKRGAIKKINVHKYSWILRLLQKPFMGFIKNKTLVFPDWTYSQLSNNNYIHQNKLNILKAFYYKNGNQDSTLDIPEININIIKSILKKYGIHETDSKVLSNLIINIIKKEAESSLDVIEQNYNVMRELIKYYKPKQIIVPDDGESPRYNILLQIMHKLNIDAITVLDGYLTYIDIDQIRIKEDGATPLVKNYATMGSINHNLIRNNFPKFNRILIKSPILSHISSIKKKADEYDALIMMPIPNTVNPNSRWDMRNKYVIDVVELLRSHNFKKIAVKVKPGHNLNDSEFLIRFFKNNNIENVDILHGYAYDAISVSKIVIGQLGTTTYESLVMNKPYYIYEPIHCGFKEVNLNRSIAKTKHIARDINTLSNNITSMETIELPIDQLVDGQRMSIRIT